MKTHVVGGNSKVPFPNVSLLPIKTCKCGIPCAKMSECYAIKFLMYPEVKLAWTDNTIMATTRREQYFADIAAYLTRRAPRWFRWHVAGDFIDQDYLDRVFKIAKQFPETRFLAFTKRTELRYTGRPGNLSIVFSAWPGLPMGRRRGPIAWMQDGTETRVPADAVHCPGNCGSCMVCWDLARRGMDVVFDKH